MTEQEWLTATEPRRMLRCVQPTATDRKLLLFCVAACLRSYRKNRNHTLLEAYEVAERFVEHAAGLEEVRRHWKIGEGPPEQPTYPEQPFERATMFTALAGDEEAVEQGALPDKGELVPLLIDVFGNPFRPVTFTPDWRTPTVTSLAQTVYDDRQLPSGLFNNQRLAVLADALEEAGCDNADILGHLRGDGEHVRGCWVVDLVLGKE